MIISQDWLFVSTMKCATNTMYEALPGQRKGKGVHPRPKGRLRPVHFTVCRNPYDRAVSIWASTCLREKDRYNAIKRIQSQGGDYTNFDDFCRYCLTSYHWTWNQWLFRNQTDWHPVIDRFVHIENLKEETEAIVGEIPKLPTINKSDHEHWRHYMSDTAVEIINEWAGRDFELGYLHLRVS